MIGRFFVRFSKMAVPLLAISFAALGCDRGRRPDVVIISLDTVRGDVLQPNPESSGLEALARLRREAVTFESAYSTTPFTLSSHLTMMTGASARVHRVRHRRKRLSDQIPTLPEYLRESGYRTAGVYSSELLGPEFGFGRGFDTWVVQGGGAEAVRERAETLVSEASADGSPIFLFVHFYDAHSDFHKPTNTLPYSVPLKYRGGGETDGSSEFCDAKGRCATQYLLALNREGSSLTDEVEVELSRLYRLGVRYLEKELDLLLQSLIEAGVWDDALLIVTADHGEELGEHGMYLHNQLFEEVIRVPLIVRFPGGESATQRRDDVVLLEDILPTVLDVAGISIADQPWVEGREFRSIPADEDLARLFLAQEIARYRRYAVSDGEFKLHFEQDGSILALYDVGSDPGETVDRSGELVSLTESLRDRAEARIKEQDSLAGEYGGVPLEMDPDRDAEARDRLEALGYLQ